MSVGSRNGGQQRQNPTSAQEPGPGPQDWSALKEDVGEIAGAAVERGRTLLGSTLDSAKDQATSYVDQRKDEAAKVVADLATSLREACREFDDRPNIRGFVDSAAGGLEQLAGSIRERSFNEIFELGEDLVRRRPGSVAVVTMVAGFLAARFIKSSAENIRETEAQRRRGAGPGRAPGQGQGRGPGQRARAQSSPGSAYAESGA